MVAQTAGEDRPGDSQKRPQTGNLACQPAHAKRLRERPMCRSALRFAQRFWRSVSRFWRVRNRHIGAAVPCPLQRDSGAPDRLTDDVEGLTAPSFPRGGSAASWAWSCRAWLDGRNVGRTRVRAAGSTAALTVLISIDCVPSRPDRRRRDLLDGAASSLGRLFHPTLEASLAHRRGDEARVENVQRDPSTGNLVGDALSECRDRSLCCSVRGFSGDRYTHAVRGDVHDRAAPAARHTWQDGKGARDGSEEVDGHDALVDVQRRADRTHRGVDAGHVCKHVDMPFRRADVMEDLRVATRC